MAEVVNPFGGAPAQPEEAQQQTLVAPPTDPWQAGPVSADAADGTELSFTFKQHGGHDASWVVLRTPSTARAKEILTSPEFKEILELTSFGADFFHSLGGGATVSANRGSGGGGGGYRQPPPAGATEPPAGAPASPGPGWVYRTGITKSGNFAGQAWHGWMPPDEAKAAGSKPLYFKVG